MPACAAALSEADAKAKLATIQRQIQDLNKTLQDNHSQHAQLAAEVNAAEKQVANTTRLLRAEEKALKVTRDKIAEIEAKIQDNEALQKTVEAHLATQVQALYVLERQRYLNIILSVDALDELNRLMTYLQYLNQHRLAEMAHLSAIKTQHVTLAAELHAEQAKVQVAVEKQNTLTQQVKEQQKLRTEKMQAMADAIKKQKTDVASLSKDEKDVQKFLAGLQKSWDNSGLESKGKGAFAKQRGKLPLPTTGKVNPLYGKARVVDSHVKWNGVMIAAPEGQLVRAVYPGRVVYADWLRGFGLMTILDHGNGYMTLYAHNRTLLKTMGDSVKAGDVIAHVGKSGGMDTAGLYFEIRHQGKPMNPVPWLKVTPS